MSNNFNTPAEMVSINIDAGIHKAHSTVKRTILMGIIAGAFIALGAASSGMASHSIQNYGLSKLVAGLVFPVGLMLIIIVGGELFTSNCLISMAVYDKKVPCYKLVKNLFLIFLSNAIGAIFIALLLHGAGVLGQNHGEFGAYAIKTAVGKVNLTPVQCLLSGILCNCLVCLATFMASTAKDIAGKCLGILFPIAAFIILGFEHCVANMYYLPAGILASLNDECVQKASELYGITAQDIAQINAANIAGNLFPVTIGNMIGGMVCIGLAFYVAHLKWDKHN